MSERKILVWGLTNNRAGTEAIIKNYVQLCDSASFDFLCYEEPTNHSEIFENGNNRYYVFPAKSRNIVGYYRKLVRFMRKNAKKYNALWMNINDTANIDALIWAKRYGISKRIVHMHSSKVSNDFLIRLFSFYNKRRCINKATDYWACSEKAGEFLYGDRSFKVIPNIVDPKNIEYSAAARHQIRDTYHLDNCFVIGAVGRLSEVKNLEFIIRIFPMLLKKKANTRFLVVGDGELREGLEQLVCRNGFSDKIIFVGSQKNVAAYYSALDAFVMPSFFEGLPVSLLEAQFNGLPCVISDRISDESIISSNVQQISLSEAEHWVDCLSSILCRENKLDYERAKKYTFIEGKRSAQVMFD